MISEISKRGGTLSLLIIGVTCLSFMAGYFHDTIESNLNLKSSRHSSTAKYMNKRELLEDNEKKLKKVHDEAIASVSQESIKELLKYFTSVPHLAGTPESLEQAEYVKAKLLSYGFDDAEIKEYFVLLSYPKKPGKVVIYKDDDTVYKEMEIIEKVLHESEKDERVVYPFVAYSASGDVEGEPIYANYGQEKDFKVLQSMGIDVKDKILLIRYGRIYRGDKVKFAQQAGAKGLLLFSDPEDFNPEGEGYPHTWFLPDTGIQRGNVMMKKGDTVTPGYPSKVPYFHVNIENSTVMPQIPVQPISARDAEAIMKNMDGITPGDQEWQGGFDFTYNITASKGLRVGMTVSVFKERRKIQNVIGTIYGEVEPDRLVIAGNHRDAWVFGAVDPSSGTAALLEGARAIGEIRNAGWRPRRTIKFCSWDGEEFGIIGSTEWTEEYQEILDKRGIAYLNIDSAVEGNEVFRLKSSPLMTDSVFDITKEFRDPNSEKTLYDGWKDTTPDEDNKDEPKVALLGSGSDFAPFQSRIGIPCIDFRYTYLKKKSGLTSYPVYHSVHDNYHWMTTFVDPTMKYHRRVAEVLVALTLKYADSMIVPFNVKRYATQLTEYVDEFEKSNKNDIQTNNLDIVILRKSVNQFTNSVNEFYKRIDDISLDDTLALRAINDQLSQLERNFIVQEGLPDRRSIRHVLFSPSRTNNYAGSVFPGVVDAMHNVETGKGDWDDVKVQLTQVVYHIEMASASLKQLGLKNI